MNVRLTDAIDVDASAAGQAFKAVVDDPVMIGGAIVIPRGASATLQAVHVEQSGTMKGSDKISLKLHSFRFGGMVYDVSTAYVEAKGKGEGKKTARKVGGGAGLGAIVGGIAGGGSGRRDRCGCRRRRRRGRRERRRRTSELCRPKRVSSSSSRPPSPFALNRRRR